MSKTFTVLDVLCSEGMAEVEGVIEELSERMETGEISGLPDMSDLTFDHASGEEEGSEEGVSEEDEDDDDDDLMEEDPYNSAGEEVIWWGHGA